MTKNIWKKFSLIVTFIFMVILTGCSKSDDNSADNMQNNVPQGESGGAGTSAVTELEVCFGDEGKPFILHLYDNETAAVIAKHVGTENWRLQSIIMMTMIIGKSCSITIYRRDMRFRRLRKQLLQKRQERFIIQIPTVLFFSLGMQK